MDFEVRLDCVYVIAFISYNSLRTDDILYLLIVSSTWEADAGALYGQGTRKETGDVITGITHSQIPFNLILSVVIYDCVLNTQEMDVGLSKMGQADKKWHAVSERLKMTHSL